MPDAAGHPRGIRRRLGTTRRSAFPGDDWPDPSRAEPSRAEPSRAEPSRAEPSRAEKDLQNAREREDT